MSLQATLDVSFQNPLRRTLPRKVDETLRERIGRRPFGPESEGDAVGGTFRDWVQREQMKRLHRAVLHRRDGGFILPLLQRDFGFGVLSA